LSDQTQPYRYSTLDFYCTLQHVSAVQINRHQGVGTYLMRWTA